MYIEDLQFERVRSRCDIIALAGISVVATASFLAQPASATTTDVTTNTTEGE